MTTQRRHAKAVTQQAQRRRLLYWHKTRERAMHHSIVEIDTGMMTRWHGLPYEEVRRVADALERKFPGKRFAVISSSRPFAIPAHRRLCFSEEET